MRAFVFVAGLLVPLVAQAAAPPVLPSQGASELRKGNARFAAALHAELARGEGNLCFSPYSISSAFGMLSVGARGETLRQMETALRLPAQERLHSAMKAIREELASRNSKNVELRVANALWAQEGFPVLAGFNDTLRTYHGAEMDTTDFAMNPELSRLMLNRWVALKTRKKVRDLFPPRSITPTTRLVLANAIYFEAAWASRFKKDHTRPGPFHSPTGKVEVPMMRQVGEFPTGKWNGCRLVELPFSGGDLALTLIIPDEGKSLEEAEKGLATGEFLASPPGLKPERIELRLPRFKLASSIGLIPALKQLGMKDLFTIGKADLSGIARSEDLAVSDVFHKAVLEIDEDGGRAAAASGIVIIGRSKPPIVSVDRPFVFVLRDRTTGTVLFLGRLTDPTKG